MAFPVPKHEPAHGRPIVSRTRGATHGPLTRLMSPGDLGQVLKPFVFLDLVDHEGEPFAGSLHPHSGIATLSYLLEGEVRYIDYDGSEGVLPAKGVEWMQAGRGMWHGGGLEKAGRTRGFQLWIALPPELELGPASSVYQTPEHVPTAGPARVLLGSLGGISNALLSSGSVVYLAVQLKAGERWRFDPSPGHTVLWAAVAKGSISVPEMLQHGELAVFAPSQDSVEFEAVTDAEFVVGSAVPHPHELALGNYSVHTSPDTLRAGETEIASIKKQLIQEGRLQVTKA
ncbi:redox-sensitive bicupin YhaK (pirin superfamily) [Nitrobacteraceae bacterium AZCC 2146]